MMDIYITLLIILGSIVLFFVKYAYTTRELKLLGIFLLVTFVFELYANYLLYYSIRNLYVYHILIPVQYALLAGIYIYALVNRTLKRIIVFSIPVVVVVSAVFAFTIQPITAYNSYAVSIKNILLAAWVLCYYRELFVLLHVSRIEQEPLFWISTGLLFYSLGDFFVEGLMNHMISHSMDLAQKFYYVYYLLNILLYLSFIMAFLCKDIFTQKYKV
jgi:hypothetical protein